MSRYKRTFQWIIKQKRSPLDGISIKECSEMIPVIARAAIGAIQAKAMIKRVLCSLSKPTDKAIKVAKKYGLRIDKKKEEKKDNAKRYS